MFDYFSYLWNERLLNIIQEFFNVRHFTSHNEFLQTSFGVFFVVVDVTLLLRFSVLASLLTLRVSCLSVGQILCVSCFTFWY